MSRDFSVLLGIHIVLTVLSLNLIGAVVDANGISGRFSNLYLIGCAK